MGAPQHKIDDISVRLASSEQDISAAQHLRYRVFYEEYAATPDDDMAGSQRDMDIFDTISDHLIVIDKTIEDKEKQIVGTYRLLRRDVAEKHGQFYTSNEYNIDPILNYDSSILELGRSCVLFEYRTRPVLQMLWQGIVEYVLSHDINLMFGCASFHGTDVNAISKQLSYLYHHHLAPEEIRARALDQRFVNMNIHAKETLSEKECFAALPPLIKGYLRVGCKIGDGAVVDHQFNTTDVCIIVPTNEIAARYKNHYSRKINEKAGTA